MNHSWPVITLKTVDSTNNYANNLIAENLNFTECVISAETQTQGRGQKNNSWISEGNKNLTFSIALRTDYLNAENQFLLSQSISLAVIDFLQSLEIDSRIKWPNDILVDSKKIAGILIENTIMGSYLFSSVVGIGLNVNQVNFPVIENTPVSIKQIKNREYDCDKLSKSLVDSIWQRIENLKNNKTDTIKEEYLSMLFRNQVWSVFKSGHTTFEGKIIDVTNFGELVILSADGKLRKFMFQEVQMTL